MLVLTFIIMWVRFSYPRFREDQLQAFAWKVLIPLSLANIIERVPETRVTWVTHGEQSEQQAGPIVLDRLDDRPQIRSLVEAANQCVHAGNPHDL